MADPSFQWSYDVFLSFRGTDTRNNFTAHLFKELCTKGIDTFMDEERLETGQVISPALVAAIKSSKFSIIVLSENYASSRWCLEELVTILQCMRTRGQRVFPIFYNMDPSDVRNQRGNFGEALTKHEENLENMERMPIWRDALTRVAHLSGWDSRNKNEATLVEEIASFIFDQKIKMASSDDADDLVGIDSRICEMEPLLCLKTADVRIIGIWGMSGIGKTTLAGAIFDRFRNQFEGCVFFENVGTELERKGIEGLQEELLSKVLRLKNLSLTGRPSIKAALHSKKVLIVLDNVKDSMVIEKLAKERDWFGPGSRIIITTTNKEVLRTREDKEIYEVKELDRDQAMKFFSRCVFKQDSPKNDFVELSKGIIARTHGIPIAIKLLGGLLINKSKHEWETKLDKLTRDLKLGIQKVFQMSYNELNDDEKRLFQHIASFFKGWDIDYVTEILDRRNCFAIDGINALVDKSFITISRNKLQIHDLLQEMGREVVFQKSPEPGKRIGLWMPEDISHVLKNNTGTEEVEGIFLNLSCVKETLHFTTLAFARMNNLKWFKVYNSDISTNDRGGYKRENCNVRFSKDFKCHYDELRYLHLHGYPLKSLPNDFNPKNLVELSMPYSHIKELWKGIKVLEKLKFMDLSHSKYLIETPNFSGITNLKRLVLEDCVSLRKVHSSLGNLKNLSFLNLKNCKMLKILPSSTCYLKSLETLIIFGCKSLEMSTELYADETALKVLPSFSFLRTLKILSFKGCKRPLYTSWLLPRSSNSVGSILQPLSGLCFLTKLDLSDCNLSDETNLSSLGFLSSLKVLSLCGNDFVTLPSAINRLSNLKTLMFGDCKRLQVLPELPSSLSIIAADNCASLKDVSYQVLKLLLPNTKWEAHYFMDTLRYFKKGKRRFLQGRSNGLMAFIPGSRIPDWIRYQSSGSEVKAELPPNSFNSNFLGFAFSFVIFPQFCFWFMFGVDIWFDWPSSYDPSSVDFTPEDMILLKGWLQLDHVFLFYVPVPQLRDRLQATRIKVSFKIISAPEQHTEIERCGVGLVYRNEDGNHNNPPMIQFDSISSPPPPPPNKSTVVLEEIHEREPSGNGSSNVHGSGVENSKYHTADEEEPSTVTACSEDHSESDMRPQKSLKCRD